MFVVLSPNPGHHRMLIIERVLREVLTDSEHHRMRIIEEVPQDLQGNQFPENQPYFGAALRQYTHKHTHRESKARVTIGRE